MKSVSMNSVNCVLFVVVLVLVVMCCMNKSNEGFSGTGVGLHGNPRSGQHVRMINGVPTWYNVVRNKSLCKKNLNGCLSKKTHCCDGGGFCENVCNKIHNDLNFATKAVTTCPDPSTIKMLSLNPRTWQDPSVCSGSYCIPSDFLDADAGTTINGNKVPIIYTGQ